MFILFVLSDTATAKRRERHMFWSCGTRSDINFKRTKWNTLFNKEHNKVLCFLCIFIVRTLGGQASG